MAGTILYCDVLNNVNSIISAEENKYITVSVT